MVAPANGDAKLAALVARWAEGKATLKEVRGYTDEELYAVAKAAHIYFSQGMLPEAQVLFRGLLAISPRDAYFARGLGVVEYAAGNPDGALQAFDLAVKLEPDNASGYVGRAEVRLAAGQRREADADLRKAVTLCKDKDPLKAKAEAMLQGLAKKK